MDLNIFKQPDPSGKLCKESFLQKTYKDEYDYIINYCYINNLNDLPFKEKVFLSINNLNSKPICKNPNCKNPVKFKNMSLGFLKYCSNRCIGSDPDIIKKKEELSISKFGTKTPAESKEIKDKIIKTNQKKYGGNSAMSSNEIKVKSKETLIKNWGVDNPSKSNIILEKRVDKFKENIDSYKESYKKKSIEKYGVNHPWMVKEIHEKTILKTNLTKNKTLLDNIEKKLTDNELYDLVSIDYNIYKRGIEIHCKTCDSNFNINREEFHLRIKNKTKLCTLCNPIYSGKSGMEMELYDFINKNYSGEILLNSRKIIPPTEIDIYLPELKIGFEFNGLFWHSDKMKSKYYHLEKTKRCRILGIELIHIWEDDWIHKQDIVKSIILNRICKINKKIWARKCRLEEIKNVNISKDFLNKNHILGNCNSNIKIGLYNDDELISLMCFSRRSDSIYELVRFCNKINHIVVGASSKIFKYFLNNNNISKIISYSDESMFTGSVYEKLGFKLDGISPINYKWVLDNKRWHKSKWRKDRLVKAGYDSNKSENNIMVEEFGAHKIWDCGLKRWIYIN